MANRLPKQTADEKDALLAKVPAAAKRVQVQTRDGKRRYKFRDQIVDSDILATDGNGGPVYMMGMPGRPPAARSVSTLPTATNSASAEAIAKVRNKSVLMGSDHLLKIVKDRPDDTSVVYALLAALGEETASLKFEREEAERLGESTASLSVKRVHALTALANTWLKHKDQLLVKEVDLKSLSFQAVARFMMETFKEAMLDTGMRVEMVESVFAKASMAMAKPDWESEAKARMKHSA